MRIITGKDAIFETENYDVILIGTSIYGIMSCGFAGKIANKYPYVQEANVHQTYGDFRRLGTRLTIEMEGKPTISLMYICGYPKRGLKTLDMNALQNCLLTAKAEFKGKKVMMTIPGIHDFDGSGDRDIILGFMEVEYRDFDVDVYDYRQIRVNDEMKETVRRLKEMGITDASRRREILKKLYLIK